MNRQIVFRIMSKTPPMTEPLLENTEVPSADIEDKPGHEGEEPSVHQKLLQETETKEDDNTEGTRVELPEHDESKNGEDKETPSQLAEDSGQMYWWNSPLSPMIWWPVSTISFVLLLYLIPTVINMKLSCRPTTFWGLKYVTDPRPLEHYDWIAKPIHDPRSRPKNFKHSDHRRLDAWRMMLDHAHLMPTGLKPSRHAANKNTKVSVYIIDHFLKEDECEALKVVHEKHIKLKTGEPIVCFENFQAYRDMLRHLAKEYEASVAHKNDFHEGTKCLNNTMSWLLVQWGIEWSYTTEFFASESNFSTVFNDRVEKITGLKPHHGSGFRLVSYSGYINERAHRDCTPGGSLEEPFATVQIYLNDIFEGGQTSFPEMDINVQPRMGRALVWNNMNGDGLCEGGSLHGEDYVFSKLHGKPYKLLLQRWYHYRTSPGLSDRPIEPSLPPRTPDQPLIYCPFLPHTICRWKDSWSNQILA